MATMTRTTVLKTAIATYPHTKGLKDGTVTAPGLQFEHIEVSPITAAFRRMCRTLEFDVAEMAITTYLTAKAYNNLSRPCRSLSSASSIMPPSFITCTLG